MTRPHAHAPAFIDTARPLPFQMRHARFMTAPAGDDGAGAPAGDGQVSQNGGQDDTAGQSGAGGTDDAGNGGQGGTGESGDSGKGSGLPDDPEQLKAMIADLRREAGASRVNAKQQAADEARNALAQEIGKALGLVKDDTDTGPKPEELTAQVQAAQAQAREAAVQLAVYRTAAKHDGDPDALLDSRTFLKAVADLDPSAGDFGTKVDQAIKAAVDTNPKLKASQAGAHRSGQDFTGGTGEGRVRTPKSLTDAVATRYGS